MIEQHVFIYFSLVELICCSLTCLRLHSIAKDLCIRLRARANFPSDKFLQQEKIIDDLYSVGNIELLEWFVQRLCYPPLVEAQLSQVTAAASGGHLELIKKLHEVGVAPEAFFRAPEEACKIGHLALLEFLHKNKLGDFGWQCCATAASRNQLYVIKWLRTRQVTWDDSTAFQAAKHGHLELLEWCIDNGCEAGTACGGALTGGRMDALKLARAKGVKYWILDTPTICAEIGAYDLMKYVIADGVRPSESTMDAVAKHGDLDMLRWLHNQGVMATSNAVKSAVLSGSFEVLQWLMDTFPSAVIAGATEPCTSAADTGNLEMMQFLLSKGYRLDYMAFGSALMRGHMHILEFLHCHQCPYDPQALSHAAANGHLSCIQYMRSNGYEWDTDTCNGAAIGGQLDVLKWLRSQNPPCPWNTFICECAASLGSLEMLKWAAENGAPFNLRGCAKMGERWRAVSKWLAVLLQSPDRQRGLNLVASE